MVDLDDFALWEALEFEVADSVSLSDSRKVPVGIQFNKFFY